jgi:hypothetical protein
VGKIRAGIADHIPAIIDKLVEQAKGGDASAARLLLERVIAPLKAMESPALVPLPAGSLAAQAQAVVRAAADGNLAPGQAALIVNALGGVARIVETTDLIERIEALEAQKRDGRSEP